MFNRSTVLVALAAILCLLVIQPAGAAMPRRIVSLSPTATESLFAIGAGAQVVAVDEQSDFPRRAPRTSLSGYTPNLEAIAAFRPDLVVLESDANDVASGLRRLGIRVLVQTAPKTLPGAYAQIRRLGEATGHPRKAARLISSMRREIARIVKAARGARMSVYHELTPDLYSATSRTFIGRIYKLFGLRNIADAADSSGSGYPQLSAEYVVSSNPGLIVLADSRCCGQSPASVRARPGWGGVAAVRTGRIVPVDDSVASRWGPRVVQFVRIVGKALPRRVR